MKNLEKICKSVFEKMGFENFGVGGEFRVHPLRGFPDLICVLRLVALGTLKKNKLRIGGIAPNLGEIWGFEIMQIGQL